MGRVTIIGREMHTWNPNDSYLDLRSPCFGGLNHQKGGQGVIRFVYINNATYIYT